jgi:hypothetical protein
MMNAEACGFLESRTGTPPFGQHLEQQLGAAFVEFHVSQFIDGEAVDASVDRGDAGGAAPQLPQQAPALEGGHGLFAEAADEGVGGVDRLLPGGQAGPATPERHPDGSADALIALVSFTCSR